MIYWKQFSNGNLKVNGCVAYSEGDGLTDFQRFETLDIEVWKEIMRDGNKWSSMVVTA